MAQEPLLRLEKRQSSESDADLLNRFRKGDDQAASGLFDRYGERIRALAAGHCGRDLSPRLDPEDIVQSVFRSFFVGAARGNYRVEEEENLWNLLMVMTLNKVRSTGEYHRAAKRDVRLTSTGEGHLKLSGSMTEQELSDLRLLIGEVLEQFPKKARRLVQLRLAGHEVAEIAQQTACSKRTVERVLQEFRFALHVELRDW